MNKEKIIISFVAVSIGLLAAVGIFFVYQKTKAIAPGKISKINVASPSPSPQKNFLSLDSPKDESVTSSASVTVSGETSPGAKIVIVTPTTQQSAAPTSSGSFSSSVGLESGENLITVFSIMRSGEILIVKRTVTQSSESF